MCCFYAEGEDDGPDEELEKLFTTVLSFGLPRKLSDGAKIPIRYAIYVNCAHRSSQIIVRAHRKA